MWVRTRLKISSATLFTSLLRSFLPIDRNAALRKVEGYFGRPDETVACLSLRSGFDLLLRGLNLVPGDEVLFSALNVRAMVKIVNSLGLVPVPVDIDLSTMAPRADLLQQAITSRSKVFVAAHLFGSRADFSEAFTIARQRGIVAVEDCAQAFNGMSYRGSSLADVVMYSFGPIKTATALGGGLMIVADREVATRMRAIQSTCPVQPSAKQRKRIIKFIGLKLVTSRMMLGLIFRYYKARGQNYEDALADRVRDVAPLGKPSKMRQQPSALMLWMMSRRLYGFDQNTIAARQAAGRNLTEQINGFANLPGQANPHHDYWVYPVLTDNPKALIGQMRDAGFDAADLPRSQHIAPPADRPELEPAAAAQFMKQIVVLPCYAEMPNSEIARLAQTLKRQAPPSFTSRQHSG
jgi:perosamine synthetase